MKIQIYIISGLLLGCGFNSEDGKWSPQYPKGRGPSVKESKSVFGWLVDSEASGQAPIGNSWNEYWKGRFYHLRKNKTKEEADFIIDFVKTERNKRGLPPLE